MECELFTYQSNHEGNLIDKIHNWSDSGVSGLIINPGGFTHTSVALRDAIVASNLSTVEVHLSNIHTREDFRHKSLISGVVKAVIAGTGAKGYVYALRYLTETFNFLHPQKEIITLIICNDECREVFDFYFANSFHTQVFIFQGFHFLNTILGSLAAEPPILPR